jgi:hypothetical protein
MLSNTDLPQQSETSQQQLRALKSRKPPALIVAILLTAIVAGTGGYLLGSRNTQSVPLSQPLPLSTRTPQSIAGKSVPSPRLGLLTTPRAPSEVVRWITYTDATLGATFEYPSTWNRIYAGDDKEDYRLVFKEPAWPGNDGVYISAVNYPENISLADFYRRYSPGGAERFKNISFKEIVNSHGIKFGSIVQPYTEPRVHETVHNGREYEITNTFSLPPAVYQQEAITEYNHLVDSFTFIEEGKSLSKSPR